MNLDCFRLIEKMVRRVFACFLILLAFLRVGLFRPDRRLCCSRGPSLSMRIEVIILFGCNSYLYFRRFAMMNASISFMLEISFLSLCWKTISLDSLSCPCLWKFALYTDDVVMVGFNVNILESMSGLDELPCSTNDHQNA